MMKLFVVSHYIQITCAVKTDHFIIVKLKNSYTFRAKQKFSYDIILVQYYLTFQ